VTEILIAILIGLVAFVIGFFVGNAHGWNVAADIGDKDMITERSRRVCAEQTAKHLEEQLQAKDKKLQAVRDALS
jgi:hypothetical protein